MRREQILKRRHVREIFNVSDYGIGKMIECGILEPPIKDIGRHPYWVTSQIERAEQKLRERAMPKAVVKMRPLSEKMKARIRAECLPHKPKPWPY